MDNALTVRDLLLPGEPLDPGEVLAGREHLYNPVTWVVSLRPYPPAFPRLRGGELALVASELLSRLDPPTSLSDVIRQLATRGAAAVAVRGEIDDHALETARLSGLPLIGLQADAPMHDIEQAVMRVCALYQARREILPSEDPDAWISDLLSGKIASQAEAQSLARRHGKRLTSHYSVAYFYPTEGGKNHALPQALQRQLENEARSSGLALPIHPWDEGVAVLLPQELGERLIGILRAAGAGCGLGTERPLLEVSRSVSEALAASTASRYLSGGKPVLYSEMGSDRLLVLLYREHPDDLVMFVEQTLGPLMRRDSEAPTPLLATLESFVMHGGKLRETASDIYVHRNTLAYRLDRAAEILGANLKDPQVRLSLELALRALPLVRALKSS